MWIEVSKGVLVDDDLWQACEVYRWDYLDALGFAVFRLPSLSEIRSLRRLDLLVCFFVCRIRLLAPDSRTRPLQIRLDRYLRGFEVSYATSSWR